MALKLQRGIAASVLPAFREVRSNRRSPRGFVSEFFTRSFDGVELRCELIESDARRVVVVAHPAVVGSRYRQVIALANALSESFSVVIFDFRGHGRSGGRCPLGFNDVSRDLEAVVERSSAMGFEKIGIAGFSLGAAAAVLLLSRRPCAGAAALIGCPPEFPDISGAVRHPLLFRAFLRLLGMRVDTVPDGGENPADVAFRLQGIPKLLVFGESEVFPASEIERFAASFPPPCERITIEGAWHADLMGKEDDVKRWFEDQLR